MKAMYIGRVHLENYSLFKGVHILDMLDDNGQLHQWTVILGNNNTGKTNILKAIADLEPVSIDFDKDSPDSAVPVNMIVDRGKYYYFSEYDKEMYVGCDIYYEEGKKKVGLTNKKLKQYGDSGSSGRVKAWWGYKGYEWTGGLYSEVKSLNLYGYGVSRRVFRNGLSDNNERKGAGNNTESLFSASAFLANMEEWLQQLDYASKSGKKEAAERLRKVKELLVSELFPEISDLKFVASANLKNIVLFKTKEGWFRFEDLGYGYQTTLAWIIDFAKKMFERYPKSKNPLKEPAVVLIDELDLHLHPTWQRSIITYLSETFTSTQFIVTTHSPFIIQTLERINLYVLKKEGNTVRLERKPQHTYQGWRVEEILNEVMDVGSLTSERYSGLIRDFESALDANNRAKAKRVYEKLKAIMHPNNPERKLMEIQLSQM